MIRVTIIQGAEGGAEVKEFLSGQISIGRVGRNDLVLVNSRVSSVHARAIASESGITLIDNNSTNGTFVNGALVRGPVTVEPEDSVEIGSFTLHFESIHLAGDEGMADDPMLSEISPSEFDEFGDEPGEFGEPELLPLEATPQDGMVAPLAYDDGPDGLDMDPMLGDDLSLELPVPGALPETHADARLPGPAPASGITPVHTLMPVATVATPTTGLAGAFERTVAATGTTQVNEAAAVTHARAAVDACCPDFDPRQRRQWSEWIAREVAGLGPLTDLLADDSVAEVLVRGAELIEVRRDGPSTRHPTRFSCERAALLACARMIGASPSPQRPTLDGIIEGDVAVHAVGRPLVHGGPIIVLSRPQAGPGSLTEMVTLGQLAADTAETIVAAVVRGANVIVAGPPGLDTSAWLAAIVGAAPSQARVVALHRGRVARALCHRAIVVDGANDMSTALRSALRMRPDYLVVHELGATEALELCAAARRGSGSTIASIAAATTEGALARMQAMVGLTVSGEPVAIRRYVAGCFDLVLVLREGSGGRVVVAGLAEIQHAHGDELVELLSPGR